VGVPGYRMTIVDFVIAVIIAMAIVGILLYTKSEAQDWVAQLLLLLARKKSAVSGKYKRCWLPLRLRNLSTLC